MRNFIKYIVAFIFFVCMVTVHAQHRLPITALQTDSVYVELCNRESVLQKNEDRLLAEVDNLRSTINSLPENAKALETLEIELFSVQIQLVDLSERLDAIEQEWMLRNMNSNTNSSDTNGEKVDVNSVNTNANLVYNNFFKDNLTAKDYLSLLEVQESESKVAELLGEYNDAYNMIVGLDTAYFKALTVAETDSLYAEREALIKNNIKLMSEITTFCQDSIYNVKSFCYNYILDKNGESDMLDNVETLLSDMKIEINNIDDGVYKEIASYPYMKQFLLKYEIMLAEYIGSASSVDSLKSELAKINTDKYIYHENPSLLRAADVNYQAAEIGSSSVYNSRNPIPEIEMGSNGTVYSILLGRYSQKQSPSIFRNTSPLFCSRDENGKYCYYAGYYPTLRTAEEAAVMLKEKGFRNPIVSLWNKDFSENTGDGKMVSISSKTQKEDKATSVSGNMFRVEIQNAGNVLSDELRNIISTMAPDKELSRIVSNGNYIFYIGAFDNKDAANALATELDAASDNIDISVNEIQ